MFKSKKIHPFNLRSGDWDRIKQVLNELFLERSVDLFLRLDCQPFPMKHIDMLTSLLVTECIKNNDLISMLPDSLKTLELSSECKWNRPIKIGSLPSHLETLVFNPHFDQVIQVGTFPASLTSLTLGQSFNQSLNGVLPTSITSLDMSRIVSAYDYSLNNLPASLTTIHLPMFYNNDINHPPLERLYVDYFVPSLNPMPALTELTISSLDPSINFALFPRLTRLVIVRANDSICTSLLPWSTLKSASLCCVLVTWIDRQVIIKDLIPMGVESLKLGRCNFIDVPPGSLPSSLTHLTLTRADNIKPGDIPASVTSLELWSFYQRLDILITCLPPSIRALGFHKKVIIDGCGFMDLSSLNKFFIPSV
ncbi:hypothetical protein SAMD00019534_084510 [Acytostelium subglobosum LB1]|uniref:hypothetical protein n=1 Tax=Acytostelium subglobosum LB1 TaxID=1410327 RepID=UPI000644CD65|nr:hypothetical protein SAMD00019534_084510 [Acytostelium subglobosum LB1]GAM25276.1 hypothetical protein SAMD00019534_084510 [Acytostelium subglobosum LB1]|eukprot:XP_012751796.1 hypothetical protein SAMD00019534_084510 [Acytostelium subglobosum LB1]